MSKNDRIDSDGYVHGYCSPDGNFLGFAPYMTLIPNLIPAKRHAASGIVVPTGHQKILPKGKILMTDAGFGGAGANETVMSGLEDDVGGGLAPTGAIPGTAIPDENNTGPQISEALREKIASRNKPSAKKEGSATE